MTEVTGDVIRYPIVTEHALEVDPVYLELQSRGPVRVQLPYGEQCWVATGYEDVKAVHGDRRFGKEIGVEHDPPRLHPRPAIDPSMLAMMDPPRHTRIRKLTSATFAKPRVRAMADWVDRLVLELVDEMAVEAGGADFMNFSWTLPNHVVTGILGIPEEDVPMFRRWIDTMTAAGSTLEQRIENRDLLIDYIKGLIAARRSEPTDDVLSELVQARDDDDRLTEDELVMLSLSLFLGGFETTVAELGSMVFTLLSRRHLWEELVADRDLLPAAIDELFRWIPSFRYGFPNPRWAIEDVELSNGVVIPAGDAIIGERSLSGRDESVYPHASVIEFHREDPAPHLMLGWGPHHCVGAHLATLELHRSLAAILDRFPTMHLTVDPGEVEWSTQTLLRSPVSLPVAW